MRGEAIDVAILGAGAAGCATALALHGSGIDDVALFDAGTSVRGDWVGESMPPDASGLLKALGLWELFQADGHEPCLGSCAAWGGAELGYNDFLSNLGGAGWHIHRPRFDRLLRRTVAARGITLQTSRRLAGVEPLPPGGGFKLRFTAENADRIVVARHVVDATGPRGAFARSIGAPSFQYDLLVFLTATVALAEGAWPSRLSMTETVEDGWWYAAAIPGNRLSLAFATDPMISRKRRLDRPGEWLKALAATRHIGPRLADMPLALGPLVVRAVPVSARERPCGEGWTAVGDAAAIFDPLGSEGLYKAMEDGIRAAEAIHASLLNHEDRSADYARRIADNTQDHLALRQYFYALERQWPESLFWKNRLGNGGGGSRVAN